MRNILDSDALGSWGRMTMCEATRPSPAFRERPGHTEPTGTTSVASPSSSLQAGAREVEIRAGGAGVKGTLAWPSHPSGFVLFTRIGGRQLQDRRLAERLRWEGLGTLLIDSNIGGQGSGSELEVAQLLALIAWLVRQPEADGRPIGCLGLGVGVRGALAAAGSSPRIGAVVSCGGDPREQGERLFTVRAPTLFIAGDEDYEQLRLAHPDLTRGHGPVCLTHIPGAGSLQDGRALDEAGCRAAQWFVRHLIMEPACRAAHPPPAGDTNRRKPTCEPCALSPAYETSGPWTGSSDSFSESFCSASTAPWSRRDDI